MQLPALFWFGFDIHQAHKFSCRWKFADHLPVLSTNIPITGQSLEFDVLSQDFITISISLCNLSATSFCFCKLSAPTPRHFYLLTIIRVPKYLAKKILSWPPSAISLTNSSSDGCMSRTKRKLSSSFTVSAGLGSLCGRSSVQRCSGALPEYNSATTEGIRSTNNSEGMSSSNSEELLVLLLRLQLSGFTSWFWPGECESAPEVCTTWEETGPSLSPLPRPFESLLSMMS